VGRVVAWSPVVLNVLPFKLFIARRSVAVRAPFVGAIRMRV
ncbi:MAG: hypothetical protein QOG89_700, partial [Thermomicrobiales bacterium]|nr:hypothetical protein [Thermomicrobiales bacterium]